MFTPFTVSEPVNSVKLQITHECWWIGANMALLYIKLYIIIVQQRRKFEALYLASSEAFRNKNPLSYKTST